MLSTNYYSDKAIFNLEKEKIFLKNWVFFGLINEFTNKNNIIKKKVFGVDVIITKNKNLFKAFLNICPHRFNKILDTDSTLHSENQIRCKYHGWCFNLDGSIKKIPLKDQLYQKNFEKLSLNRINIKIVGNFIFLNFSKRKENIEAQFSKKILKFLFDISKKINEFEIIELKRNFNWKLIIENLRDPLHPLFLHPTSLLKNIKFSTPGIPKWLPIFFLRKKYISYGGPDTEINNPSYENLFIDRWSAKNKYHNYHLFPNLHIACPDNGCTFLIENFIPISSNKTLIQIYYVYTKHRMDNKTFEEFKSKQFSSSMKVYNEDFNLIEKIQNNLDSNIYLHPHNGKYERMILRFHGFYLRKIGIFKYYKNKINLLLSNILNINR